MRELRLPGDKSISHRALLLAALAIGESRLVGLNEGEDVDALLQALIQLGVSIKTPFSKVSQEILMTGVGLQGLRSSQTPLDLGNSGTGTRLLLGVLAAHPFTASLLGDASLMKRPMRRVMTPLAQRGVFFQARENQYLPLTITGLKIPSSALQSHSLDLASAQVKSALLLAGLQWPGFTRLEEKIPSRDHTERLFSYLGIELLQTPSSQGYMLELQGGKAFSARDIVIPRDPSAAAFFALAATLLPETSLRFLSVLWNPFRNAFFEVLVKMGGLVSFTQPRFCCGESIVDLEIRSSSLSAIDIPASLAPRLIDEYPILACAAACASGKSRFRGLGELRYKESDRLAKIYEFLTLSGIESGIEGDDLWIQGSPGQIRGGVELNPGLDHRLAMAFAILGLRSESPIRIKNPQVVRSSFPQFWTELDSLSQSLD